MKITKEEWVRLNNFNHEVIGLGYRRRKGTIFMRKSQKSSLDFDTICGNIDYLEKKKEKEENGLMKYKYEFAIKFLQDILEEGKYEGKE